MLFFNFLDKNLPDTKVILHPNSHLFKVLKSDGSVYEQPLFKQHYNQFNFYTDLLDGYILKNFDVDVLHFDENLLIDENHLWGFILCIMILNIMIWLHDN